MRSSICLCMSLCEGEGGWGYMSWFYTWIMGLEIEGIVMGYVQWLARYYILYPTSLEFIRKRKF
jgi:hypothetical protein